jgi:phosphate transport system permease protein
MAMSDSLVQPSLPRLAPAIAGVLAVAVAGLLFLLTGWHLVGFLVVAGLLYLVVLPVWSFVVESRRAAVDRLTTTLVFGAALVAMVPLVWLIVFVLEKGLPGISWTFLTSNMRNVDGLPGSPAGGMFHALVGTLVVTFVAAVISIPIGLLTAIYLVEYGKGRRLARTITFLVDVMTGIPSIVAGLFALALFVLIFGPQIRFGFGGSVAISLLMIPIVVRSAEEMLRLVPVDLREASLALGVPKWRTIMKVVVPTALGGIVTGVTLAISRVIGETAPLLVVAGLTDSTNANPFSGRMTTLPVYIYYQYTQPGIVKFGSPPGTDAPGVGRAWAAALVLIVLVMALNLLARLVGKIFAPKKG